MWFINAVMQLRDADTKSNSADSDQTAPLGAV